MKKANLISILILSSVLLTSCSDAPISGDDFISKISPNLWDFLAVFAAFIVLILIVFFFGYKPIKKLLQKRRDYVEGKISNAEQRENKSKQILSDAEKVLSDSKKEAIEIVKNNGGTPVAVAVLIDKSGIDEIDGIPIESLIKVSQLN